LNLSNFERLFAGFAILAKIDGIGIKHQQGHAVLQCVKPTAHGLAIFRVKSHVHLVNNHVSQAASNFVGCVLLCVLACWFLIIDLVLFFLRVYIFSIDRKDKSLKTKLKKNSFLKRILLYIF